MSNENQQNQKEFIQDIVNTALEQANTFQSKNLNSGLNIRNVNIRMADVLIIVGFATTTVFAFTTNYYKINSYIDISKPKIEKLETSVKTFQEFKLETKLKLDNCSIKKLEREIKMARKMSIDASNQVQDVYSHVNSLINKIEKLERQIEKLERQNNN